MRRPTLVLVNGHPGTGKTTLAEWLATEFSVPCIRKDVFKEALYEHRMPADREASRDYGRLAYDLAFVATEAVLQSGTSAILEAPFHRQYSAAPLQRLVATTGASLIQLVLTADPAVLEVRELERRAAGQRHPGHYVGFTIEEFRAGVARPIDAPSIDPTLTLDTTSFEAVDRPFVLRCLTERLATADPDAM